VHHEEAAEVIYMRRGGIVVVAVGGVRGRSIIAIVVLNVHHGRGNHEEEECGQDEHYHVEYDVKQQYSGSASVHSHEDSEMEQKGHQRTKKSHSKYPCNCVKHHEEDQKLL